DDRSDDLVDDEALIKAYNRAVSTNENEFTLQKQPSTSTTGSGSHKQQKKKGSKKTDTQASSKARDWKVGDFCRCTYSVDGRCYEAKIKFVDQEACTVRYIGYGNEEEVYLSELLPSEGKFRGSGRQIRPGERMQPARPPRRAKKNVARRPVTPLVCQKRITNIM
ncbi:survival motor neuron protein, putative, partial [Ixodes scapularis]